MSRPTNKMTRNDLIHWLDEHGDGQYKKTFADHCFDPTTGRMSKPDLLALCSECWTQLRKIKDGAE